MHTQKRGGIISALLLLHLAVEKRRALGEEYLEGGQRRIGHDVALVVALAPCVGQQRKSSADPLDQKRGAQRRRG
jgi:hypothetical protein